jgi:Skp family chaperone for outer membrane proteins
MFKFLTALLPPWLNPWLIGTISLCLLSAALSGWAVHKLGQVPYSRLEADRAKLDADYSAYRAAVAENSAKASADAFAEQKRLQAAVAALESNLAETKRKDDAKSAALQKLLAGAKPGDMRPVGPVAGAYYDRLRGQ